MIRVDRDGKKQIAQTDFRARAQISQDRKNKGRRKLGRPPAWRYPRGVEMQYRIFLRKIANEMRRVVKNALQNVDEIIAERDAEHRVDSWSDSLENTLNVVKIGFDNATSPALVNGSLFNIGKRTSDYNSDQWKKITKAVLGVDVYTPERFLKSHIQSFVKENSTLITQLKESTFSDISRTLTSGIRNGDRIGQIKKDILSNSDLEPGRFRKVETRAELIARDQIGKLNGELTLNRQTALGIDKYTWRTVKDERVRGDPSGLYPKSKPSHFDREGKVYSWNSPPDGGHPGEAIQCRCFAEPIFDDAEFEAPLTGEEIFLKPAEKPVEITVPDVPGILPLKETEGDVLLESLRSRAIVNDFAESYKARMGDASVKYADAKAIKNTAKTAVELHADALSVESQLKNVVELAAESVKGEAYFGPENKFAVKSMKSIVEKISERGKTVDSISDGVRGTVIVKDLKDVEGAVSTLKMQLEKYGNKLLKVDDKFATPIMDSGYVGVHIDVVFKTPAGRIVKGEIQIHNGEMSVKEISEKLYQSVRTKEIIPETIKNESRKLFEPFMKKNMR